MSNNNKICYSVKIQSFSRTKRGLSRILELHTRKDALSTQRKWLCCVILASCKLYQPNNLLGSCSTEPARTLVHYQPTLDISILKGGQLPACISSKRKLTGRTVSVRVKQQIVANAERNSAHKYNSCTAISRRGVKLTTHKASIQN